MRYVKIFLCSAIALLSTIYLAEHIVAGEIIWVEIPSPKYVIDSFNGVDAIYTNENNADDDEVYSCAAYVKRYYSTIYGVDVYNLHNNGPPILRDSESGTLIRVDVPIPGDIIFYPTSNNSNNHSAIVTSFNNVDEISIIEQNYKSQNRAAVNRSISYPSDKYQIWRYDGDAVIDAFAYDIPIFIDDGTSFYIDSNLDSAFGSDSDPYSEYTETDYPDIAAQPNYPAAEEQPVSSIRLTGLWLRRWMLRLNYAIQY